MEKKSRTKPKHSTFMLVLSFLFVTLTLVGCSKSEDKPVKFGFIGPLTGPAASYGVAQQKGIELAVTEINASGGVSGRKLSVIYEDSQMDPNKAITAMKKLVDIDDVRAVIGATTTTCTLAIADIADRRKVVLLSPSASGAEVTDAGEYVFRASPSDIFQAKVMARYVFDEGFKTGAIIFTNDAWGSGLQKEFERDFTERGGKILSTQGCTPKTQDFRTQLVKVREQKAEFVYIPLYPDEAAVFLRQAKELNLKARIFGGDNFSEKAILKTAGTAANGVVFAMPTEPSGPTFKKFSEELQAKSGSSGNYSSAVAYDCVYLLVNAVKQSGDSGEAIKNALLQVRDYQGASGVIGFDRKGDVVTKNFSIIKIEEGKYITIDQK